MAMGDPESKPHSKSNLVSSALRSMTKMHCNRHHASPRNPPGSKKKKNSRGGAPDPPWIKKKLGREIFWKFNWGAEFFENSIFHEFLIQGGLGGAEHPPARYKVLIVPQGSPPGSPGSPWRWLT